MKIPTEPETGVGGALYLAEAALRQVAQLLNDARSNVSMLVAPNGRVDNALVQDHQIAAHGYAWYATYFHALTQLHRWGTDLHAEGKLGPLEDAILRVGFGEYLAQMAGGIAMSQSEFVRPADLGISPEALALFQKGAVGQLIAVGGDATQKARIAKLVGDALNGGSFGDAGLGDETSEMLRDQLHRFVDRAIAPHAHQWHMQNALIPREVIDQLAELGVFGLTVGEQYGGLDMGKLAMCVVTEELSRGYIGVGSLGTRAEIAAELIARGGTSEQRSQWLPRIVSGATLPTAVFTEPNTGSDLGSLQTRAVNKDGRYRITGNKTWITHAARADLMVLLARTDTTTTDYRGLSMFLVPKTPANDENPFPDDGIDGTEIEVLGYRGMREYELRFENFPVPDGGLLGEQEGLGFKQLMNTFESARIQTAARAVGVAQNALELGLRYAQDRQQFGKPIVAFARIAGKIGWMVVETMIARQLTYFAAREKDADHRCDIEAGMAKLLAARVAWSNADNALQIHGGNGYAVEYEISRVLCDARILNIFEGAAEIQAQVVARGLLARNRG
jgi:(2S)-methylsuccinyl-CoA dehydrogenase